MPKLKLKLTKEEYASLNESLQGLYAETDEGFALDVDGIEDTGALKRAKEHEKAARKLAEDKTREMREQFEQLQKQLEEAGNADSRKKGDIEAIEASYQKKLKEAEEKARLEVDKLTSTLKNSTLESHARKLATDLSGESADLILPHILRKLSVDLEEGTPKIRVLGDDGQPTADSLDDLREFFFTNKTYAPIVVGSKASGGGAAGAKGGGATTKKLSDMTATEEALFAKQNPEKYMQMIERDSAL